MNDAPWKKAALLEDRVKRAIQDRYTAGESIQDLAKDYGVPKAYVEFLVSGHRVTYDRHV